jgi:wyosine [tRNA(Phe)-imidazoG37] synthetase (radical SAM superfamily)
MTNERRDYVDPERLVRETLAALEGPEGSQIDWVTIVGSGEPLLHASLGKVIRRLKEATDVPIAVITNGALLYRPEVRAELGPADAVLPSLDAGSPGLYRRINRPWPELTFERLVAGLVAFRREYQGRLWMEVMLVRGLNDGDAALAELAAVFEQIGPDAVQINQPVRPAAEPWVRSPSKAALRRAQERLSHVARPIRPPSAGHFALSGSQDPVDACLEIIARHPLSEQELLGAVERQWPGAGPSTISRLAASGRAQRVRRRGLRFWTLATGSYPPSRPATP